MASNISTGNGTTIAFGTSAYSFTVTKIGGFTQEREALDASDLSTVDFAKVLAGDLVAPGEFEVEGIFDSGTDMSEAGVIPPITGAAETITITPPKGSNTTAGSVSGTGFIKSFTSAEFSNEDLMRFSFTVAWEGGAATSPDWAAAVA